VDITSRIKLEAQGADQAAREIRKLKDAYDAVAASARGISPSGGLGADPFSKATSTPGGPVVGGQRPSDIAERESRGRYHREQIQRREEENKRYNSGIRNAPGGINGALGFAESLQAGRGGSAIGTASNSLGSLIKGPAGAGLLAMGAAAFGAQKLSENAFERLQNIWGTGMAQRMGIGFKPIENQMVRFGRMGIPIGMLSQFYSAAGTSGLNMGRSSSQGGVNDTLTAAAMMGLDPSIGAMLLGTLSRGGINVHNVANLGTYSSMRGSFGQSNVTMFTQALAQAVENALTKGVSMSTGSSIRAMNWMGGYAKFGGLSPQGAVSLSQLATERGRSAAMLNRPEDVIAFQAMRQSGMSVSDTMLAMEQSPNIVNQRVYEYLKRSTGGSRDLLRIRMRNYLGGSMSQAEAFIKTASSMEGLSDKEIQRRLGSENQAWIGVTKDKATNEYKSTSEEVRIFQVRQNQMLKGFEDTMLKLTTDVQGAIINGFKGGMEFAPWSMSSTGRAPTNADIVGHYLSGRQQKELSTWLTSSKAKRATSGSRAGFGGLDISHLSSVMGAGTSYTNSQWIDFLKELNDSASTGRATTLGSWGPMFADMMSSLAASAGSQLEKRGMRPTQRSEELFRIFGDLGNLRNDQNAQMADVLTRLSNVITELEKRNLVFTDGDE
jgi:hypothetical protein